MTPRLLHITDPGLCAGAGLAVGWAGGREAATSRHGASVLSGPCAESPEGGAPKLRAEIRRCSPEPVPFDMRLGGRRGLLEGGL